MAKGSSISAQRRRAIEALRKRTAERPDSNELFRTIMAFKLGAPISTESDRAAALLLGAILEQGLETAILSHCIRMEDAEVSRLFGPPEGTPMAFDTKIRIAYALGVYGPDARDDLDCIKHIRNLFAHARLLMTFTSPEVINGCEHIKWIDKIGWGGIMGDKPITARHKFIETTLNYYVYLAVSRDKPLKYLEDTLSWLYS